MKSFHKISSYKMQIIIIEHNTDKNENERHTSSFIQEIWNTEYLWKN